MKLSIKFKLIIGFMVIVLMLLALGSISYFKTSTLNEISSKVYNNGVVPIQTLGRLDGNIKQIRGDVYKYIFFATDRATFKQTIQSEINLVNDDITAYRSMADTAEKQEQLALLESNWKTYTSELEKIFNATDSGNQEQAVALMADGSTVVTARGVFVGALNQLVDIENAGAVALNKQSDSVFSSTIAVILLFAAAALIISIIVAIVLIQSLTGPINKVKNALQKMATGDFTKTVTVKSTDEVGAMAQSYNEMQKSVSALILQLKQNARQLASASDQLSQAAKQTGLATQQVATSSQQMAKGAQEQSNSAQETAKSIEELSGAISQLAVSSREQSGGVQKAVSSINSMSQTVSQVAVNAKQAAELAKNANASATDGADKTRLTLEGMDKIKKATTESARKIEELGIRSAEIGKIVAVIDDIASQTNLLALNAAIEAARAGDQGRGFAVVSDEVRKLAERTASATKEIAELISGVQKVVTEATTVMAGGSTAVSDGYKLATEAQKTLEEIRQSAKAVNSEIEEISVKVQQVNAATEDLVKVIDNVGGITEQNTTASEHMTASASQVSKVVETVAGIAEENSAATEEVSASAEEMSAQVEEIVASSQTLKEMADALKNSSAAFKVKSGEEII